MPLVTSKELFAKAYKGRYAIGAFNVDNVDIMKAVLKAAERTKSPVIIAISSGALGFIGKECVKNAIDDALKSITIPVVLHLDHGKSVELCKECVDIGFTSVMIDASGYDFDKNIAITKEVVEYAHARGVVVESELGAIAGIEEDIHVEDKYGHFTHPEDVIEFVSKTGIDSLAIAIGTAHGAFKFRPGQKPQLRFDILEEIEAKLPGFPLVL
ncbi:MAG: class II fructose-bisphosphate aldolase, partial [Bacilli bacterium]